MVASEIQRPPHSGQMRGMPVNLMNEGEAA